MKRVTIKIPEPLYLRLKTIIEGTGFSSVTEFVVYVLRDLAAHDGRDNVSQPSEAELQVIVERLRSLGYLD
jgi:metal-responsive CopG/Arc/MetJ family transcriptional regulator